MANQQRSTWSTNIGFIMAAVGSAIGLGNVWRFSFLCHRHGGGAFLIPYFIALLIVGIPLMLVEYGLGHRERGGSALSFRRVGRVWEWGGWWMPIAAMFGIMLYYAAVIGWCISYLLLSFNLGWGEDPESYFLDGYLRVSEVAPGFAARPAEAPPAEPPAATNGESPPEASTPTPALDPAGAAAPPPSESMRLGRLRWMILAPTLFVWFLCWFVCFRDVAHGIERACMIFMPLLFVLTVILVVWSLTLPGATDAIRNHYLHFDWAKINPFQSDPEGRLAALAAWRDAFGQIFFTLSLGFGIMITYASYLPRKSDMVTNALATCLINCGYSFIAGFVVFGVVGFMAHSQAVPFEEAISTGPPLAFIVYPKAISLLPVLKQVFGVMFFLVLLLAGVSSGISLVEAFGCSLTDKFGWSREKVVTGVCVAGFAGSVVFCTQAGLIMLDIVDHFVSYALVLGGLLECIVVGWILRSYVMRKHIQEASGRKVPILWDIAVLVVIPAFLAFILVSGIYSEFQKNYEGYKSAALLLFGAGWMGVLALAALVFTLFPWKAGRLAREHRESEDQLFV